MSEASNTELLTSQIEIVNQACGFLKQLNQEQYNLIPAPHFTSSAGKHMRHILDHYLALQSGLETGQVDYDQRSRGGLLETDVNQALRCWENIHQWLLNICEGAFERAVTVKTEVSIHRQQSLTTSSTLARELIFVASHAIHHFSLLAVVCSLQGIRLEDNFGVAPATVTHLRKLAG